MRNQHCGHENHHVQRRQYTHAALHSVSIGVFACLKERQYGFMGAIILALAYQCALPPYLSISSCVQSSLRYPPGLLIIPT